MKRLTGGLVARTLLVCAALGLVIVAGSVALLLQTEAIKDSQAADDRVAREVALTQQIDTDVVDLRYDLHEFAEHGGPEVLADLRSDNDELAGRLASLERIAHAPQLVRNLQSAVQSFSARHLRPVEDTARTDPKAARLLAEQPGAREALDSIRTETYELVRAALREEERAHGAVTAALRKLTLAVGGLGLLGVGLVAIVGIVTARRVAHPLHRLAVATRRVAARDLQVRVPEQGVADLRTLAEGFNSMVAAIDGYQREIEHQRDALRTTERHFRALVDHAADMITLVAADGTVTYQSPASRPLLGIEPEEVEGRPISDLVHPGDLDLLEMARASLFEGDPERLHLRWRTSEGEYVPTEAVVTPHPDDAGTVITSRDAREREALEAELRRLALHDPLTGVANRVLFRDRLDQAFRKRGRGAGPAVAFIDVDDFKEINDALGHDAGDEVLRAVSEALLTTVRAEDTVGRVGGDEFAVLFDAVHSQDTLLEAASRMQRAVMQTRLIAGRAVEVRVSIGAALRASGSASPEELLQDADAAMYIAKRAGGGRLECFEVSMREEVEEERRLAEEVKRATASGQLCAYYQPIAELATGRVVAVEALVRWEHPRRGLLDACDFLPAARAQRVISEIGDWMLLEACNQARRWNENRAEPLGVHVNLGESDIADVDLAERVAHALSESALDPHRLTLEVSETAVTADIDAVSERLADVQRLGVRVALDDFGTGYSSLGYLRRLPVSMLKVGAGFAGGDGRRERSILGSIVELGHGLAIVVVMKEIEGPKDRKLAIALGCELGQGFDIGRPARAGDVEETLAVVEASPTPTASVRAAAIAEGPNRDEVVFVDDHLPTLEYFGVLLDESGYDPLLAVSAPEALRLARTHHPCLVITDLQMPGMNGAQLARAMKDDSDLQRIPVVMFSRFDAGEVVDAGDLRCFDDELARPLDLTAGWLRSEISRVLVARPTGVGQAE